MEGISLVETKTLQDLILEIKSLKDSVAKSNTETDRYLNSQEAAKVIGVSEAWMCKIKQDIGYTSIGKIVRFKRSDLIAYMEANYFKTKSPRRTYK
ncbi:helix-turn-helix domain-containing protein [Mucilaginibacter sabulilitoris]|uniref:Helix-turn-helix domain-containing protein n=1 Tax=Mucilaginibacter sabulilitoris TaxID=1173583 RepID=A0ABZ0TFB0_9SPHI|nr:helix-turn-helix domain-containing protein [Mucilaginibacter sabulilitoris]WPU91847.1 helix-turn-helix domain-containing protein [Mucilaginibacter sabulilitoris]